MVIQFLETKTSWEGTLEQSAVTFLSMESMPAFFGEPFQLKRWR